MSNCIRCGQPVAQVAQFPITEHASQLTCWQMMTRRIEELERRVAELEGQRDERVEYNVVPLVSMLDGVTP